MNKPTHFDVCIDPNCERKWCVDRRTADCQNGKAECHVSEEGNSDRCVYCHTKFHCSGYGWCELHGEHGP